jgi:hypothetical protein
MKKTYSQQLRHGLPTTTMKLTALPISKITVMAMATIIKMSAIILDVLAEEDQLELVVAEMTIATIDDEVGSGEITLIGTVGVDGAIVVDIVPITTAVIGAAFASIPTKRNVRGSRNGGGSGAHVSLSLMLCHLRNSWLKRRLGRRWNRIIY